VDVRVLGSAREVGRSAFHVKAGSTKFLLDYGVSMRREPVFPIHVQPREISAVLLTHSHLDHSGGTPIFFFGDNVELLSTPLTSEITKILIEDFLNLSGPLLPFEYLELLNMMKKTRRIIPDHLSELGEAQVKFVNAGHTPGASMILVEHNGKRMLYTGDMNSDDSQLQLGASNDFGDLDLLITESTYSQSDHPNRRDLETEFVQFAKEVVERGGTLLVPAFSVGRAQELMCVLHAHSFPYTVAMDGMALKTNEILLRFQEYLRDPALFRRSLEKTEMVTTWSRRRKLVETPCVLISPAGMLVGGASVFYLSEIAKNRNNGIAIVSFQVPGSPGRSLLDKGMTLVNGKPTHVKAEIKRFDFSGHSGRKELFNFISRIKGSPKIWTVHGEPESCVKFAEEIRNQFGLDAKAPNLGESISV
jgi:putative mRNA 3-end processing factor